MTKMDKLVIKMNFKRALRSQNTKKPDSNENVNRNKPKDPTGAIPNCINVG